MVALQDAGFLRTRDFFNYYEVAKIVASEDRSNVYDAATQYKWRKTLLAPLKVTDPFPFQYPPHFLLLAYLISPFSLRDAFVIWNVVGLAFGTLGLSWVLNKRNALDRKERIVFLLGVFGSGCTFYMLLVGQISFLLVFFLSVFCICLHNKQVISGLALAASTIKPQLSPLLVFELLLLRKFGALVSFFVSFFLLLALSGLFLGWHVFESYPKFFLNAEMNADTYGVFPQGMVSLRGPISLFCDQKQVVIICATVMASFAGVLFLLWKKCRTMPEGEGLNWMLAMALLGTIIAMPHAHFQDLVLLSLTAALTMQTTNLRRIIEEERPLPLKLWHIIFLSYPFISWGQYLALVIHGTILTWQTILPSYICLLLNILLFACGYRYLSRYTPHEKTETNSV